MCNNIIKHIKRNTSSPSNTEKTNSEFKDTAKNLDLGILTCVMLVSKMINGRATAVNVVACCPLHLSSGNIFGII